MSVHDHSLPVCPACGHPPVTAPRPVSQPLSATEAATVERFDAAEPAPESWRGDDGLWEAIKAWINLTDDDWTGYAPADPVGARADSLLALPEVAALRAKAAAADRVRELVDGIGPGSPAQVRWVAEDVRDALAGPC